MDQYKKKFRLLCLSIWMIGISVFKFAIFMKHFFLFLDKYFRMFKNWKILDLKFSGIEFWLDADNNDALAKKKLSFSRTIICMSLNKIYVDRKKNFQSHQNKPSLKSSRIESIWILKCKKKVYFYSHDSEEKIPSWIWLYFWLASCVECHYNVKLYRMLLYMCMVGDY